MNPFIPRYERLVQQSSGLAIAAFAFVHLANVAAASRPGFYDAFQHSVRQVYQFPIFEVGLAVAILVHAVTGIRAMRRSRAATATLTLRMRLHRYAGWYLLVFIFGHIVAVRGLTLYEGIPAGPGFAGLSFSMAWQPWFFIPYYVLLGLGGLYHAVQGTALALGLLGQAALAQAAKKTWFRAALLFSAFAILLGIAGISGLLYPIRDPFDNPYAAIYRKMLNRLGAGSRATP